MKLPSLKTALRGNALFSTLCGIDLLLFTDQILAVMGNSIPSALLQGLGALLIVFAADLLWISSGNPIKTKFAKMIILMDWAWVISTPVVLVFAWGLLTPMGVELICIIAAFVALFATLQSKGLQLEQENEGQSQSQQLAQVTKA